jgi:AraC-like DNA-binding protein
LHFSAFSGMVPKSMSTKPQAGTDTAQVKPDCWVLHARAREYHWEGSGQLSVKTFWRGRAQYRVGCAHHAVDDSSYLVLNHGQTYSISIESRQPVESFCLFFAAGFAENVQRALSKPAGDLLDEPEVDNLAPIHFFEKNYPHDRIVSPALLRLRSEYRTHEGGWLAEQLHSIVERLLRVHRKTQAETERLESVRRATREELYRRISRARDYIGSMFAEPVTLSQLAQVACLSPNHLLRSFRKVFGGTPHQFLTERRLAEAKRLLATTELSVTEICLATGFESLGSFSYLFRRRCGCAPSMYREAKR